MNAFTERTKRGFSRAELGKGPAQVARAATARANCDRDLPIDAGQDFLLRGRARVRHTGAWRGAGRLSEHEPIQASYSKLS
jgi:hypothetical protein